MEGMRFVPDGTGGGLFIDGALTIENACKIRTAVQEALLKTDRLVLTIGENAVPDITFLQILCSAHRTAVKAGKEFTINVPLGSDFSRVISDAGFSRHKGCSGGRNGTCLWKRENTHE